MRLYTPVIKAKTNDLRAIALLSTSAQARIKPLLEAPIAIDKQKVETSIEKAVSDICRNFPEIPFYFDPLGVESPARQMAAFRALAAAGRNVIPVVSLDRELDIPRLSELTFEYGLALCARIDISDIDEASDDTWEKLQVLSKQTCMQPIELAIDLKKLKLGASISELREIVVDFLATRPKGLALGSVVTIASSTLDSVAQVEVDKSKEIERRELSLWAGVNFEMGDSVPIAFGDYGVVSPNFVFSGPNPNANGKIRYTTGTHLVYFRGHGLYKPSRFDQYHDIAQRVIDSGHYMGREFSAGDEQIFQCAKRQSGPGNLATWVRADTNHHAELTAQQIVKLQRRLGDLSKETEIPEFLAAV